MATKKKWMQKASKKMEQKGTKGSFSAAAKKAGKTSLEFAKKVLASKTASSAMKKKANFARNVIRASKRRKAK